MNVSFRMRTYEPGDDPKNDLYAFFLAFPFLRFDVFEVLLNHAIQHMDRTYRVLMKAKIEIGIEIHVRHFHYQILVRVDLKASPKAKMFLMMKSTRQIEETLMEKVRDILTQILSRNPSPRLWAYLTHPWNECKHEIVRQAE